MPVKHIEYTVPVRGASADAPTLIEGTAASGGDDVLLTGDMTVRDLLGQILIELRKLNLRQQEVFGEQINDGDI